MYFSCDSTLSILCRWTASTPQIEHNGGFIWKQLAARLVAFSQLPKPTSGSLLVIFTTMPNPTPSPCPVRRRHFVATRLLLCGRCIAISLRRYCGYRRYAWQNTLQVCEGGSTTLTATGGDAYIWVDASNPFDTLSTNNTLDIASASATTSYILTVGNSACSRQQIITVRAHRPCPPSISKPKILVLVTPLISPTYPQALHPMPPLIGILATAALSIISMACWTHRTAQQPVPIPLH